MTLEELKTKRVFISYGHDNFLPIAKRLASDLQSYVQSVWFDEKDIHSASVWTDEIEKGLENCDFVLALMTKHAYRKPAGVCVNEIVYASNKKKNICPVLVQDMDVPLILCSIQYFNIVDTFNEISGEIHEERYQEKFQALINQLLKGSFDYTGYLRDLKSFLNPQNKLNEHAVLIPNYVGRKWLDEKYDEWIKSSSSTLFIVGKPGCGKSAFSTHLCLTRPEIKGIHYCEYNDCSSTDLASIIKTLAFYLLNEFDEYRELFSDIDLSKLDSLSIDDLFSTLIKNPIRKMAGKEYNKVVVVIVDALDELKSKDVTKLLHLFATFKNEIPHWFKLLFTSRPNPAYLKELEAFHPIEIELSSQDNIDDIKEYLEKSGKDLSKEEIDIIVQRSGGVFQYVKNVLEELENNPDYDLTKLPIGLVGKYDDDFDKYFSDESFKDFSPILEVISASKEPMERAMIEEIVDDDYLLSESLDKLQAYLVAPEGKVAFFHKSIYDWLTDKESGRYYVSIKAGEKLICNYLKDNINQDVWRRNKYVVKYGYAHLYERKEYSAIAEVLSLNRGGIIDRFCYFISSVIVSNNSGLDSCFEAIIDDCPCYEYVFARLIKMLIEKGLYDECREYVVEPIEDQVSWADEYYELCKNRPLSKFDSVKELYEKMVPLVKDENILNEISDYVGDAYRLTGDFDKALYFYDKIIQSVKEKDRVQKCFVSMYNFLDVNYVRGYITAAREGMEKVLSQLDPEVDLYKLCKAYRLLGNVAYQSGYIEEARKYYSSSYEWAKESNRPLTQAESLESVAKTWVGFDNEKARKLTLEARAITERYRFMEINAKTYYPEAASYLEDGNYEKALEVAFQCEEKNMGIKYHTGTARARRYVARAYLGLGNYEKAIEYATLSVNGYKSSKTYPISRMKSYIVLLKAAKALGKVDEYASVDSLDDIYYQEMPNADKYIQEIKTLLGK